MPPDPPYKFVSSLPKRTPPPLPRKILATRLLTSWVREVRSYDFFEWRILQLDTRVSVINSVTLILVTFLEIRFVAFFTLDVLTMYL